MPDSNVTTIILAAGGSTRLGFPKQTVKFGGTTLLRRAALTAISAELGPVQIVLGASFAASMSELANLGVEVLVNDNWQRGIGSSIRIGVEAAVKARHKPAAILFMLCDQPLLTERHLRSLNVAFQSNGKKLAASAYGNGAFGTPALFDRSYFPELLALADSEGANSILKRHHEVVTTVDIPDALFDIDTPDDVSRLGTFKV